MRRRGSSLRCSDARGRIGNGWSPEKTLEVPSQTTGGGESATGIVGDPARATAALGKIGADMAVEQAVDAIRQAVTNR